MIEEGKVKGAEKDPCYHLLPDPEAEKKSGQDITLK